MRKTYTETKMFERIKLNEGDQDILTNTVIYDVGNGSYLEANEFLDIVYDDLAKALMQYGENTVNVIINIFGKLFEILNYNYFVIDEGTVCKDYFYEETKTRIGITMEVRNNSYIGTKYYTCRITIMEDDKK